MTLQADDLTISGAINAFGGTLAIQPLTPGRGILLTSSAPPGGVLAVTTDELSFVNANVLQLGGAGTTSNIVVGQSGDSVNLTASGLNVLAFNTTGALTQGGSLQVADLGGTVGSAMLTNTGNGVLSVGATLPFSTTTGGFTLVDAVGLTIGSSTVAGNALTVPSGQPVVLQTDSLSLVGNGGNLAISAPNGSLTIQTPH